MGERQTVTDFVRAAVQGVPTPDASKHQAIVEALLNGQWARPGSVAEVSRRAGLIEHQRQQARTVEISGAALTTDGLRGLNLGVWESLEPRVKALRRRLFGTDGAPFETPAAAAAWIEQDAHVRSHRFTVTAAGPDAPFLQQVQAALTDAPPEPVGFLPYQKPGVGNVIHRPVPPSGPIFELHTAVSEWAEDTNLAPYALTMTVLLDVQPLLPPARVTFHFSSHAPCWAAIHLYAPDLTVAQLRRILRDVQDAWPASARQVRLSERDVGVLYIRKQLGPPNGPAYWKRFLAMMRKARLTKKTHVSVAKMALLRAERAEGGQSRTKPASPRSRNATRSKD